MPFKDPFSKLSKRKQEMDKMSEEVTGNKPKPGTRLIVKDPEPKNMPKTGKDPEPTTKPKKMK